MSVTARATAAQRTRTHCEPLAGPLCVGRFSIRQKILKTRKSATGTVRLCYRRSKESAPVGKPGRRSGLVKAQGTELVSANRLAEARVHGK